MESASEKMASLSPSSPDQARSSNSEGKMSVEEKLRSVGEECIQEDELLNLLSNKPEPVCYDGFEPSGRIHIAQASFVKISDCSFYRNIRGTLGSNVVVVVLDCSSAISCEGIELANIDLTLSPNASKKFPLSVTRNAKIFSRGKQNPSACR